MSDLVNELARKSTQFSLENGTSGLEFFRWDEKSCAVRAAVSHMGSDTSLGLWGYSLAAQFSQVQSVYRRKRSSHLKKVQKPIAQSIALGGLRR